MLKSVIRRYLFPYRLLAYLRLIALVDIVIFIVFMGRLTDQRILAVLSFVLAISTLTAVRFIKELHRFNHRWSAFRYLLAVLFGICYPALSIVDGEIKYEEDEINWLDSAGGPGFLRIQAGHAVLVEPLRAKPIVFLEGEHFLKPFHFIRAVLPIHNVKEKIDAVDATTKDGIDVIVRDIQFGFRMISDEEIQGESVAPQPTRKSSFDLALNCFVYQRTVSGTAETQRESHIAFTDAVKAVIKSVIRDYISARQLDRLTAPRHHQSEPRQEIVKQLFSAETQGYFTGIGSKLLWVDVGYFDVPDNVENQRLNTWKSGWTGRAEITQAYGEAQWLANKELGKAEVQAEMLNSLIHALNDVGLSDNSDQNLRNVILVRTAQMLEAMTSSYQYDDEFDKKKRDSSDEIEQR